MLFVLTAFAFFFLGLEVTARGWKGETLGAWERACAVFTIGAAIWIASLWILSFTGGLQRPYLIARTVIVLAVAIGLSLARRPHPPNRIEIPRYFLIVVVPIVVWIAFILWRGAIVPPLNHDALSYHLPKAIFFSRLHGFAYLSDFVPHVRSLPANYELLLADLMTLERSDALTEWLGVLFYIGFLVASAALAERWWRNVLSTASVLLFAAGVPVLLLHSGADKNDVMASAFVVAALVWSGRFLREREVSALWLAIAALAIACGTKPQPAALVLALAPWIAYRLWKPRVTARQFAATIAFGLCCVALLGGAPYAYNLMRGVPEGASVATASQHVVTVPAYGDWVNLWQGPFVLIAAPFSTNSWQLAVPWEDAPWFWRRYELFFSELGLPFAICAILLPVALVLFRRDEPGSRHERVAVTVAALTMFLAMLPVRFWPHGMFLISLPRYALFLAPLVFAWTIAPAVRRARIAFGKALLITGAITFTAYATLMAAEDTFTPIDYVLWASTHPGRRVIPFHPRNAASVADQIAGADETIAVHARYGAWIHPLFGKRLDREVRMIPVGSESRPVPPDVDWVVLDSLYSMIWQHDQFEDLSQARRFIARGALPEADRLFLANLQRDPHFRLVFARPRDGQYIFRRVEPALLESENRGSNVTPPNSSLR
ncbi:MAG TPA: hypothetical protein VF701_03955 [Thermoanaerobaculia bacterium]